MRRAGILVLCSLVGVLLGLGIAIPVVIHLHRSGMPCWAMGNGATLCWLMGYQ